MAKLWDNRAPTTQLLGRWQPWHEGHQALFERALDKTGQVCIMVRDVEGTDESNPFDYTAVRDRIIVALGKKGYMHGSEYIVQLVPNIVNITYGRAVGYTIEQEVFDEATHAISATAVRDQMKKDGLL